MHYVIGDIHQNYTQLRTLLNKIEEQDDDARFYFVGDFVDRGPEGEELIQWMLENLSSDGKYQSVRGNHEHMAIDWYYQKFLPWYQQHGKLAAFGLPMSGYDFHKVMYWMGYRSPEKIRPVINLFESLPYDKTITLTNSQGDIITFHIVHAWIAPPDATEAEAANHYLWKRDEVLPNGYTDTVIHGHTPTFMTECLTPGRIAYNGKAINLDTGVGYKGRVKEYPCTLAALCLETMEEFYADDFS